MTTTAPIKIAYQASPTGKKFHASDRFVRAVIGPIGSGKSVMCIIELMRRAQEQAPNPHGIRKTRWAIIRNTYAELRDTTFQTFMDWFPEQFVDVLKQEFKVTVDSPMPDGTRMHAEFIFRALDRPDDIKKLLSLELTGAFINEAREIPKAVLDMLQGRVGRYPNKRDGGATWFGVLLDTNPPDSDHWWYRLFEESCPDNFEQFKQPSGVSPEAENIENLPPNYYPNMMQGKDQEWIQVYVHGEYGFLSDGKPIFHEYNDSTHADSGYEYSPDPKLPIYIGIDFGLTPAAVFGQIETSGRVVVFDEIVAHDMGAKTFAGEIKRLINHKYNTSDFDLMIYADPAGEARAQTDETTPFQILAAEGVSAIPAHTNDFTIRREAVASLLTKLDFTGKPAFILTSESKILRKALGGGYKYKRMAVSGSERYQDKPDKNKYSHVADALQYMCLGMGFGTEVIKSKQWDKELDYSNIDAQVI